MPITFASYIARCSDSGIPTSYTAAPWIAASQPCHAGADRVLVREGAGDELAAELGERPALLGAADQRPHLVAPLAQLAHHVAADEAGSSGDEDPHPRRSLSAAPGARSGAACAAYT